MLSKKEVKDIQSLGLKKHREETGLFVAEGPKIVGELLQLSPHRFQKVFAVQDWISAYQKTASDLPMQLVTADELQRISGLKTANQVLAIVQQFPSQEPVAGQGICLYLDTIQDPGNLGTIIRIADWFGVKDIVCNEGCAELYNSKVVQSTMSSIARVNVWYDNEGSWLDMQQVPILAATLKGSSIYNRQPLRAGIILIGNESKGVQQGLLERTTEQITIPRIGEAESLNAAVATGIILSHLAGH